MLIKSGVFIKCGWMGGWMGGWLEGHETVGVVIKSGVFIKIGVFIKSGVLIKSGVACQYVC